MHNSLYQHIFETRMKEEVEYQHRYDRNTLFEMNTTHINMGRQSGKTTAVRQTMLLNANSDYDFVVFTHSSRWAEEQKMKYRNEYFGMRGIYPDAHQKNIVVYTGNQNSQIENAINGISALRAGFKENKLIIFVEEPMHMTDRILNEIRYRLDKNDITDYSVFVVGCQ